MAHDFEFGSKVTAVLGQISLVREVRAICEDGGSLANDLWGLTNYLRRELPSLVPGMAKWQIDQPYEYEGFYCLEARRGFMEAVGVGGHGLRALPCALSPITPEGPTGTCSLSPRR